LSSLFTSFYISCTLFKRSLALDLLVFLAAVG